MQPYRFDPNRSAVLVISGIGHALKVETQEESGKEPRAVITLPRIFGPVLQTPVADQEIVTAHGEIEGMDARNAAGCEFRRHRVVGSAPALSVDRHTARG